MKTKIDILDEILRNDLRYVSPGLYRMILMAMDEYASQNKQVDIKGKLQELADKNISDGEFRNGYLQALNNVLEMVKSTNTFQ